MGAGGGGTLCPPHPLLLPLGPARPGPARRCDWAEDGAGRMEILMTVSKIASICTMVSERLRDRAVRRGQRGGRWGRTALRGWGSGASAVNRLWEAAPRGRAELGGFPTEALRTGSPREPPVPAHPGPRSRVPVLRGAVPLCAVRQRALGLVATAPRPEGLRAAAALALLPRGREERAEGKNSLCLWLFCCWVGVVTCRDFEQWKMLMGAFWTPIYDFHKAYRREASVSPAGIAEVARENVEWPPVEVAQVGAPRLEQRSLRRGR